MHDVDDSTTIGFNAGLDRSPLSCSRMSWKLGCRLIPHLVPIFTPGTLHPEAIGLLDSSHPRSYRCDLSAGELTELVHARQVKKKAPKERYPRCGKDRIIIARSNSDGSYR
jgi:hypothetical protein